MVAWEHQTLKLGNILPGTTVCHGHLWNLEPLSQAAPHSPGKSLKEQTGSDGRPCWSANANQTSLVTAVAAVLRERGGLFFFLHIKTKRVTVNHSAPLSCTFLAKKKNLNNSEGILPIMYTEKQSRNPRISANFGKYSSPVGKFGKHSSPGF